MMNIVGSCHMILMFGDTFQNHNLFDMSFEGDKFTWNNRQDGVSNIKAHFDRLVLVLSFSSNDAFNELWFISLFYVVACLLLGSQRKNKIFLNYNGSNNVGYIIMEFWK